MTSSERASTYEMIAATVAWHVVAPAQGFDIYEFVAYYLTGSMWSYFCDAMFDRPVKDTFGVLAGKHAKKHPSYLWAYQSGLLANRIVAEHKHLQKKSKK